MNTHPQAQLIAAVPTLFDDSGALDLTSTKAAFEWLAGQGVDGAFVAGTTGEFTCLTDEERLDVCAAAGEAFGPASTYWHVGAASARQATRLTEAAVERGAEKLAAVTPYYFPASEEAVLRYYEDLVAAAAGTPVFAYLFHARTTTTVTPQLLARIAQTGVAGVKISGEPHTAFVRYVEALGPEGPAAYSGADGEFAEVLAAGGAGVVSGVSSVLPAPFLQIRAALRSGDSAALGDAQERATRAIAAVQFGNPPHLKAVLELRGLPASTTRAPMDPLGPQDRATLADAVADLL